MTWGKAGMHPFGCYREPLCVGFQVLRNPMFSAHDRHLGELTCYFFHRPVRVSEVIFLEQT